MPYGTMGGPELILHSVRRASTSALRAVFSMCFVSLFPCDSSVHTFPLSLISRVKHQRSVEAKDARYFGVQARKLNDGVGIPRLQLAKGDKRKDHALLWASVGASLDKEQRVPGASAEAQRVGQKVTRPATDFLPIDPYVEGEDGYQRTHSSALGGEAEGLHPMETLEECITRRTKEFNQLTREHPDSVQLWLQYADFQQHAVRALHGGADGKLRDSLSKKSEGLTE